MKTSTAGRAAITRREGCVLHAYRDPRGIPTIGVGHVDMTPPKTVMGMTITKERADELLAADLGQVEAVLNTRVTVPMTQNEYDAMASLGFNIGVGGLARSNVIRRLNLGDVKGAADAFLQWSRPAVLAGRRRDERAQFLKPDEAKVDGLAHADPVPTAITIGKRGAVLAGKSGRASAGARRNSKTAAGLAAGAVIAAATSAPAPHHHGVLWVAAAALVVAALGTALLAILGHRKAATLAANADAHARADQHLDAGTTDIAKALQQ